MSRRVVDRNFSDHNQHAVGMSGFYFQDFTFKTSLKKKTFSCYRLDTGRQVVCFHSVNGITLDSESSNGGFDSPWKLWVGVYKDSVKPEWSIGGQFFSRS